MKFSSKQLGFTLIELLIAIALGLIVVAAVIGLFISVLSANNANLNEIRLNQELRAAMTMMSRDLRRAGYNASSATNTLNNPFYATGVTEMQFTDLDGDASNFERVLFAYDVDADGVLDCVSGGSQEIVGYQHSGEEIQFCHCEDSATFANCLANWEPLTNSEIVDIESLSFLPTTSEVSATASAAVITIQISGEWKQDRNFSRTITESIKVRNEHFEGW